MISIRGSSVCDAGSSGQTLYVAGQRRWQHVARVSVLMLLSLAIGGCGRSKGDKPAQLQRLRPRSVSYLEEVPVPSGFELVGERSLDHESGGRRMARHEYRGRAHPLAVRKFYREQMPNAGWDCVSDQNFNEVTTIRFEKKHESCTVQIQPGSLGQTVIHVEVVPFNRTPLEPPPRPVP